MKLVNSRSLIVLLHDALVAGLAWLLSYWLRFNLEVPEDFYVAAFQTLAWVVPLQTLIFWRFGLYRGIWRFASLPDLKRILIAVGTAALATPTVLILFRVNVVVPRSVLLLDPLLLVLLMSGSRLAYRAWKENRLNVLVHPEATPILVAGAGSAADFILREMRRTPGHWRPVGLLDDDPQMLGRHVQGVPVLGPLAALPDWAARMEVKDVVLALPSVAHEVRRRLTEDSAGIGLKVLTVPSLEDLMAGRVAISQLRAIELDDLLGRDSVKLDDSGLHQLLARRTAMVTGAGGSIGSELCRQILRFSPECLVFYESSELALYRIEQELVNIGCRSSLAFVLGSVQDAAHVGEIMDRYRPKVVFHAAAYKHVPLVEKGNAFQALRNNVLGTLACARAAREHGVEKFILVSTDKAVNPTNVMGASKRLAEMVCQALRPFPYAANRDSPGEVPGTRFISVRFGNVLGSSGSVIPKFQQQIEAGGPVTVTHPEINRFFMSIPEAAQLVLQAGLMGQGGEIFVLDMGEPVKIADLARLMIKLAGKTEDEISIEYTGLRPGEKLYEELLADEETTLPTPHPKLRVARAREVDDAQVRDILDWIQQHPTASDDDVRERLRAWLPEYRSAENQVV